MAFLKFRPLTSRFNFRKTLREEELNMEFKSYLLDDEKIIMSFASGRDVGIFTDKRILLIDIKGLRGLRRSIFTLRYESISAYELNVRSFDSAINITSDSGYKMSLNFLKPIPLTDMFRVYDLINEHLLVNNR